MSQDYDTCAVCDKLCGYEDGKATWWGNDRKGSHHSSVCEECKTKLGRKWNEYFGESTCWADFGIEVEWHSVVRILGEFKRDMAMRCETYTVTDKDRCERRSK
ncbi:MAG: hypothetical protein ABIC57_00535 [bacterium]